MYYKKGYTVFYSCYD